MRKIYVTESEMLELRKQGLSNHDIAKSLNVSHPTVLRYIGKQGGKMEGLEAFKDTPPERKKLEVKTDEVVTPPKYEPKPVAEKYLVGGNIIFLDHESRAIRVGNDIILSYEQIPDLVQFLAWAMRTRMEVTADGEEDKLQAEGREV